MAGNRTGHPHETACRCGELRTAERRAARRAARRGRRAPPPAGRSVRSATCCAGGTSSARPAVLRLAAHDPASASETPHAPTGAARSSRTDSGARHSTTTAVGRQPAELVEERRAIVGVAERRVDDHAVRVLELGSRAAGRARRRCGG